MSDYHMKLQLLEELKQAVKVKRINEEILEMLQSTMTWLLRYSKENHIPLPFDSLEDRIVKIQSLVAQIYPDSPPKNQHPSTTPRESTEP